MFFIGFEEKYARGGRNGRTAHILTGRTCAGRENMRLGVVMTGVGAQAAANVGVLRALEERGIFPHAV